MPEPIRFTTERGVADEYGIVPMTLFIANTNPVNLLLGEPEAAALTAMVASHEGVCGALEYLIGECDEDMDDDYNPHAAPLARARAALARPPVDVDVAQIAASTDAKGENQ